MTDSGNNAAELLADNARLRNDIQELTCGDERYTRLGQENEKLRKALSQRLQQLEEIRQASLTWALACPHECPACNALYEIIKGSQP